MTKSARRIHRQRVSKKHNHETSQETVATVNRKSTVTAETISMWKEFAEVNSKKLAKAKELAKLTEIDRIQAIRDAKIKRQQRMQEFGKKRHFKNDDVDDKQQVFRHKKFDSAESDSREVSTEPSKPVKVIKKPASQSV